MLFSETLIRLIYTAMAMKELPRYWKYLDIGVIIGSILAITGVLLILVKAFTHEGSYVEWIAIALTLIGIIATILVSYLATKAMKREMSPA